jgi:hypothetical protein
MLSLKVLVLYNIIRDLLEKNGKLLDLIDGLLSRKYLDVEIKS